jgi:hypothetical protein
VSERYENLLCPRQLGFAVSGGTEAAVHAARKYLTNMSDTIFVKTDFSNAFNTLRRDAILESVGKQIPELLPYVLSSYSESSQLHFGKYL